MISKNNKLLFKIVVNNNLFVKKNSFEYFPIDSLLNEIRF